MTDHDYDLLVIGSAFGGTVTALRLSEKGHDVGCYGTQRIDPLSDAVVLSGAPGALQFAGQDASGR